VCDPNSGGSSIKAANQSEITAEDCVVCSGVTCVAASDNSTVTLLRCAVYDAQVKRKPSNPNLKSQTLTLKRSATRSLRATMLPWTLASA
jgi:hypothetical protein